MAREAGQDQALALLLPDEALVGAEFLEAALGFEYAVAVVVSEIHWL